MTGRIDNASNPANQEHIAIIGAGMLGLYLALRLSQSGKRITLIEASSQIGGQTVSQKLGNITWDTYYHVIAPGDDHLLALLEELGLSDKLHWSTTQTGFYSGGKLYPMSSTLDFIRFPLLNLWQKFRLGITILRAAAIRNFKAYENATAMGWLTRHSGEAVTTRLWKPLLKSKFGGQYHELSAAFIIRLIQRMFGARQGSSKQECFGYVDGGYHTIITALVTELEKQQVTILTDTPATQLTQENGRCIISTATGNIEADKAIITLAPPLLAKLCPQLSDAEKQQATDTNYLGIACASLLSKKAVSPYYITNIVDSDSAFTGVIEISALVDRAQFSGMHLIYLPRYVASNDMIFNMPEAELTAQFTDSLLSMYPDLSREDIVILRVARNRYILPLPTTRLLTSQLPHQLSLEKLYYASTCHITDGVLTVNRMLALAEKLMRQF